MWTLILNEENKILRTHIIRGCIYLNKDKIDIWGNKFIF